MSSESFLNLAFRASLKELIAKTMFTITVLEILLFEGTSVLGSAHRVPANERVKFSVKN